VISNPTLNPHSYPNQSMLSMMHSHSQRLNWVENMVDIEKALEYVHKSIQSTLCYRMMGYDVDEIATRMGRSTRTIKRYIAIAKLSLASLFDSSY
jgi:DNA-directed RNA polymerase specialized sigma24 family protein